MLFLFLGEEQQTNKLLGSTEAVIIHFPGGAAITAGLRYVVRSIRGIIPLHFSLLCDRSVCSMKSATSSDMFTAG